MACWLGPESLPFVLSSLTRRAGSAGEYKTLIHVPRLSGSVESES